MSEAENARWYVVHTYSGYENKVKADIEKTKENRNLQDQIIEVVVPVEDATEIKNGKPKSIERKILPGYVLINMIMNDVTWYVVVIQEVSQDLLDQIQESLFRSQRKN